mmetsp:Transcript_27533/g.91575  ORF Transcript_27533/g.91575 Transcript_27533/m.91575 type:complete len:263 (-) Transcript_27533:851-1639(-)
MHKSPQIPHRETRHAPLVSPKHAALLPRAHSRPRRRLHHARGRACRAGAPAAGEPAVPRPRHAQRVARRLCSRLQRGAVPRQAVELGERALQRLVQRLVLGAQLPRPRLGRHRPLCRGRARPRRLGRLCERRVFAGRRRRRSVFRGAGAALGGGAGRLGRLRLRLRLRHRRLLVALRQRRRLLCRLGALVRLGGSGGGRVGLLQRRLLLADGSLLLEERRLGRRLGFLCSRRLRLCAAGRRIPRLEGRRQPRLRLLRPPAAA